MLTFAKGTLLLPESYTSYLLGAIAIGIGIGAVCAGYMSRNRIELGLVPLGAFGMTVFCLLLALPAGVFEAALTPLRWIGIDGLGAQLGALPGVTIGYFASVLVVVFFMGFFGGVFDVPLAASIQARAPMGQKGGVIATTNMLTFVGMAFSSIFMLALGSIMGPRQLFAVTGILTLAMGLYISLRLPHLLLRAVLWALAGTFFKVHVGGRQHVTAQGGALWVANHISILDALALAASTDRNIHFVMDKRVLEVPWMRRICGMLNVIAVDARDDSALQATVKEIQRRIAQGNVVCVNSECRMVLDGPEVPWFKDYSLLVEPTMAPIVPVHMSRLWEKVYIFRDGRLILRRRFLRRMPIHVHYTPPTLHADGITVRTAIADAGLDSYLHREHDADLLHRGFIKSARRNLRHRAISDATSGELSYFKALVGSIIIARKLQRILDHQPMIALLLPPSVGGTLANLSVQMLGKVAVNLNYTASEVVIASCARQCNITQVLTSKKFLEKLPMAVPGQPIFLEDIKESVKGSDRIVAMILALFAPIRVLEKMLGAPRRTENDLATVIFSSGSEGEPKGVMLTHRNIMSNVVSALEVFPHDRDTCLIGYLPFFHSFGYMATLWMPLCNGLSATFHPNPLEPKQIGELSKKYRGTIMIGTSTLLQGFIRKCTPEQFEALDFVICGAEKLAARVRTAFKEKFGVEPLEGYGTTECAPAVSVNIPDCVSPGFYYHGTKHGSIGRPLPGQRVRVVNPDTGVPVELGESGLLLVKGPNIMQGYLHQPEKTATVLQDGWYATGDIAALDEEGFITITDRLARFSKIAGEMVPHTRVEEALHTLLELTEQSMAVASVPDAQKGEKLVVLHVLEETQVQELLGKMDQSGLPNLWLPRAGAFYRIEQIPVLGNGKMDIKTIKQMAQSLEAK